MQSESNDLSSGPRFDSHPDHKFVVFVPDKNEIKSLHDLLTPFFMNFWIEGDMNETEFLMYHYGHARNKSQFLDFLEHAKGGGHWIQYPTEFLREESRRKHFRSGELPPILNTSRLMNQIEKFINDKRAKIKSNIDRDEAVELIIIVLTKTALVPAESSSALRRFLKGELKSIKTIIAFGQRPTLLGSFFHNLDEQKLLFMTGAKLRKQIISAFTGVAPATSEPSKVPFSGIS